MAVIFDEKIKQFLSFSGRKRTRKGRESCDKTISLFFFVVKNRKRATGHRLSPSSLLASSSLSPTFPLFEAMSGVRDLLKNLPARCVCRSAVAASAESATKRDWETALPSTQAFDASVVSLISLHCVSCTSHCSPLQVRDHGCRR